MMLRNEERADAARTLFLQDHRVLGDALDAADAGTDQDAGGPCSSVVCGFQSDPQRYVCGGDT